MIDGVKIWEKCIPFVQKNFLLLEEICRKIQAHAAGRITISEMVIRPAFAYDIEEAVVIDTELVCGVDTRFYFLEDICTMVMDLELNLTNEDVKVLREHIFLQVDRQRGE